MTVIDTGAGQICDEIVEEHPGLDPEVVATVVEAVLSKVEWER